MQKHGKWLAVPSLLLIMVSFLPHIPVEIWWLDLFLHFKLQYLVLLLLSGGLCALFYRKTWLILALSVSCLWNMAFILPFYIPSKTPTEAEGITVVSINLLRENQEFNKVKEYLKETDPDILILLEYSEAWKSVLSGIAQNFETVREWPRTNNFGIAVFCKGRMDTRILKPEGLPLTFVLNGTVGEIPVKLVATHPFPPVGQNRFWMRNTQLALISEVLTANNSAVILAGDLNTSSFSPFFRQLLDSNPHMKDSRNGFGLQPTWPAWFMTAGTTLDHILVSRNLEVLDHQTGPDIGSDHLPVLVRLRLQESLPGH